MTDNSSKLFRKILKTGLVTASGAAIMFGSTGALGAARTTTAPNVNFDTGNGLDGGGQLAPGSTVQFIDDTHNVSDFNRNVGSINMNGKTTNAIVTASVNTGSIVANGGSLAVTINNAQTLTLTGDAGGGANNYTGLGAITLGGATAGLTIDSATPAKVTTLAGDILTSDVGFGVLTVTTPTNFTGAIGTDDANYLASAVFNANSTAASLIANDVKIGAANVEVTGLFDITTLKFTADGQLTVGAGIATADLVNSASGQGTLIVTAGDINNAGSAENGAGNPGPLKQVTFNNVAGSNAGTIFATTTKIGNGGTNLTANGLITGNVQFTAAGKLTANNGITGNVDFNGQDGTVTLEDGQTITGTVDSSTGAGNLGKLVFIGDGTVTQDIGATKDINYIDIQGDNNTAVILQGNVNTQILKFTQAPANAAGIAQIKGDFAGAVTFTANVGAAGQGGILEFNDAVGASHIFAGVISNVNNAAKGQIDVNTNLLTATDSSIGLIGNVNIRDTRGFAVDANLGDVTLLQVANQFTFVGDNSQLILTNSGAAGADRVITFNDNLAPGGNVGIVTLQSKGNKLLTLNSIDGTKKLGTGDNFKALNVDGQVTISGVFPGAGQNRLNVSGADLLNLYNGATFTDEGASSGGIATINVGAARPISAATGPALPVGTAKYILDVSSFAAANAAAPVNLLSDAANNNVLSFLSVASEFTIQNTAAADQLVIFQNHVKGFDTGGAAGGGIVNLINTDAGAGATLIVSGANAKQAQLGNTNALTSLNIAGKVTVTGNPTPGAAFNALDISNSGSLNVFNGGVFIDQSATSDLIAGNIFIGEAPGGGVTGPAAHAIDVSYAPGNAKNLLTVANQIVFRDPNSAYEIQNLVNAQDTTVTLQNTLAGGYDDGVNPAVDDGGIVFLTSSNANTLTVQSKTGAETLGAVGNALSALGITGKVTIAGTAGKAVDISNTPVLDVYNGATFTDKSATSATIAAINIGADPAGGAATGAAVHVIDVSTAAGAAVNLLGDNVIFKDAGSTLKIQNTVAFDKTVTLTNSIEGNVPNGAGGIVELNAATNKLTINGGKTLGTNANKLQTLKLSGNGEIVLTGTKYFATNLDLSVKAVTLDDVPQHLEFSGDTILTETGNIASVDFKGKNAIINMANGTNITGAVTNTVAPPTNNGTINFEGTGTIGGNITGLAMLKVGAGAVTLTAGGPTVITEIQGTGTDTLTLGPDFKLTGSINSTGGKALKLNFTNGGSVSGVVGTAANSVGDITTAGVTSFASSVNAKGTATFGGTTSFADTFNNTGAVTLAAQSINTFNKQITATSMVANNATMIINAPMPISGTNLTGSGTTITLGSNQLLLSAGTQAAFTDQLTLNTNFDGTANTGGNILITGAGSEMDLSGVTKLKVVISTTNFDLNNINPNTQYTLAAAASEGTLKQLASADAIETDIGAQENQFLKWTLNPTSLVLSPSIVDNVNDRIEEELTTGDLKDASLGVKADIRALETATDPNSEGFKFKVTMGNILDNEELTTKVMKAVGDSQDQVPSSDAVNNTTVAVTNTVVSAMGSLNSRMNSFQAVNQPIAVASGDEDEAKFGVWATPFVGNSTQKMRNNINGNKTNFGGATVGFDGMINDQVVLGVAYTRAGTKIKQKNDKIGDSSKVKSNIYSIYGLYNLPNNNLFFQAVGSYSDSRIKSYSQRYQPVARNTLATQIANGNYKSRGFTGQIMAGYDYVAPQAVKLTPMVGLRYSKVKDSGYTETGTTLQNLIVKGKNYNLVNGLAGVKLSKDINTGHMILTPEIYGMLDYGFKNKLPTPDARLQGMTTPFPASKFKPVKTTWNVGAGVTAKYKMMEYGINYDANIASKYFAQQGSVKIRVNF